MKRRALLVALAVLLLASCGAGEAAAPRCDGDRRAGILAQAVPGAAYVPCVGSVPAGWSVTLFEVERGGARFSLRSDRSATQVDVRFSESCELDGATAITPRDDGVRTYLDVSSVSPRYAGRMLDVFPGGCVSYAFDFERGPHLALTDEMRATIELASRREVRQLLEEDLGVTIDG